MARYIIYGAGAVGGLIGGRLALVGRDVVLVARGSHGEALAGQGLRLRTPTTEDVVRLDVADTVSELTVGRGDTVVLTMKSQDSSAALAALRSTAAEETVIVCAQNGVDSERMALRLFEQVYGAYVFVCSAVTQPGVVACYTSPRLGVIDVGRYPRGCDERAAALAADFRAAGFDSIERQDIMRWKRGKLLVNSANVIRAACPATDMPDELIGEAGEELERCFRAAALDFASGDDINRRGADLFPLKTVRGHPFPGGSTLQDLARVAAASEVDYLNGEAALLGRMLGVPVPVNSALQRLMREMIQSGAAPGSLSAAVLRQRIQRA